MSIGRLRLLVLFFVAATSLNVLPAQCAEGQTPMQSGMENLDNKRYWSAHTDFKQAVHENPNDQQAYYYLGLSCENLKQHDEAKEAYRACYSINPFSDIGQKARKALLDVSDHMEALKHRAIDNPEIVTKTAVTIQRQAEELQGRKILDGERTANWKIRQGNFYYNRGYNTYQNGSNFTGYNRFESHYNGFGPDPNLPGMGYDLRYPNGGMPTTFLPQNGSNEVSNAQFLDRSHILYDANKQAARARGEATKSAIGIQDYSNNLIERVGRKTPDGIPPLRALGTNLYVQYYRTMDEEDELPPPPDPPLELKAKQMTLSDTQSRPAPVSGKNGK